MSAISQAERAKYAEIFQARGQVNGYMPGTLSFISTTLRDDALTFYSCKHQVQRLAMCFLVPTCLLIDLNASGKLLYPLNGKQKQWLTFDSIKGILPTLTRMAALISKSSVLPCTLLLTVSMVSNHP